MVGVANSTVRLDPGCRLRSRQQRPAAVDCIAAAAAEKPQVSVVQAHALHCQLVSGYTPRTSTTPFTVFRIMVCLDTC